MGIKYEFSVQERDCVIAALELLNESNGIQAFPEHDAFRLLDVIRSRGPQTAPGTPHAALDEVQTAPGTPPKRPFKRTECVRCRAHTSTIFCGTCRRKV